MHSGPALRCRDMALSQRLSADGRSPAYAGAATSSPFFDRDVERHALEFRGQRDAVRGHHAGIFEVMAVPPISISTANEMLAPSTLPSLIGDLHAVRSGRGPGELGAIGLERKADRNWPWPASKEPDQSPSMPAANAGAATSSNASNIPLSFERHRPPTDRFGYLQKRYHRCATLHHRRGCAVNATTNCLWRRGLPILGRQRDAGSDDG